MTRAGTARAPRVRAAAGGLAVALAAAVGAGAHEPGSSRYSWWSDVRPILARNCASCHRRGGAAPMPLLVYEEVLPWAAAIQREVLERRMPPWAPEEGHLAYRGQRLLSAREIDVLADWTTGATPEGEPDPRSRLPPPVAPLGGEGLLTLELEAVRLGPDEAGKVACLPVTSPLAEPGWITALELRPGTPRLLRRATLWSGDRCDDDATPIYVWVPGQQPLLRRDGVGEPWPPGAVLSARLEYLKPWDDDGRALEDATRLAVRLGPARREVRRLQPRPEARIAETARVLALMALAADDGDAPLRVVAESPGARPTVLLELRHPDPLWLGRYELADALTLPPGSTLRAEGGRVVVEWVAVGAGAGQPGP